MLNTYPRHMPRCIIVMCPLFILLYMSWFLLSSSEFVCSSVGDEGNYIAPYSSKVSWTKTDSTQNPLSLDVLFNRQTYLSLVRLYTLVSNMVFSNCFKFVFLIVCLADNLNWTGPTFPFFVSDILIMTLSAIPVSHMKQNILKH